MPSFADSTGRIHRFPEGTSPEEMADAVESMVPPQQTAGDQVVSAGQAATRLPSMATGAVSNVASQVPSVVSKANTMITDQLLPYLKGVQQRTGSSVADTMASMGGLEQQERDIQGIQGPRLISDTQNTMGRGLEALTQIGGAVASGGGEVIGEAVAQAIPDAVKEKLSAGLQAFVESDTGKAAIDIWEKTGGAYGEHLKKTDPETYKTLTSLVDVGLLIAPVKTPRISTVLGKAANKLEGGRLYGKANDISEDLLAPPKRMGEGKTTESKILRRREYHPTAYEKGIAEEIAKVKGVNPNRSYTHNQEVLDKAAVAAARKLDADIDKAGNPKMDLEEISNTLGKRVDQLEDADPENWASIKGNREAVDWAKGIMTYGIKLLQESDGTAKGVLNARRKLDQWVDTQEKGLDYDASRNRARKVAQKVMRDVLNDRVNTAVPSAKVAEQLAAQHKMWTAYDILREKMLHEAQNPASRAIEKLSGTTHVGPIGGLAIGGTIGGTVGLSAVPTLIAVLGGAGLGYAGFQGLKWAARKKLVGDAVKLNAKAMKKAEGVALDKLKAERLALIQLMNQPQEETP